MIKIALSLISALTVVLASNQSRANLVNLGDGSFTPAATQITFNEFASGTLNPTITLAAGALGNVTVSFAGSFQGQTISSGFPQTLSDHTPTGPLALGAGNTMTTDDSSSSTSPVLSGDPRFNGPISVFFSTPVAAVGLTGGFFDAVGSTTIEAYDANGNVLGSIVNSVTGFEFYGLADSSGGNVISGISFFITGDEPAGFEIDNLTFGAKGVVHGNVPESGSFLFVYLGLGLLAFFFRRQMMTAKFI